MTSDLNARLHAKIDELEALAEEAKLATRSAGWWETSDPLGFHVEPLEHNRERLGRVVLGAGEDMGVSDNESAMIAAFIAANDPSTVLAGIAEDRKLLEIIKVCRTGYGQRSALVAAEIADQIEASLARRHRIEVE